MRPEEFVKILNRDVIKGNLELYQSLLDTTNEATDPVWKGILPIYINFSREEKEIFLNFLKIVEINTLSHVLGILDGTTYADGIEQDFILTVENDNRKINEDLQDISVSICMPAFRSQAPKVSKRHLIPEYKVFQVREV